MAIILVKAHLSLQNKKFYLKAVLLFSFRDRGRKWREKKLLVGKANVCNPFKTRKSEYLLWFGASPHSSTFKDSMLMQIAAISDKNAQQNRTHPSSPEHQHHAHAPEVITLLHTNLQRMRRFTLFMKIYLMIDWAVILTPASIQLVIVWELFSIKLNKEKCISKEGTEQTSL